jgi:hypothetical protein
MGFTQPVIEWLSGKKRLERGAEHLPTFITDVKNEWSYVSAPLLRFHSLDRAAFLFSFANKLK